MIMIVILPNVLNVVVAIYKIICVLIVGVNTMTECNDKNCTCKNHKKKSYVGKTVNHDYH